MTTGFDGYAQKNFQTLDYLYKISGNKIISGIHNREPNAIPDQWTQYLYETTGKYPALWSGDFLFQKENIEDRWIMIFEAEKQWQKGAIINIMWHGCPPNEGEPCGWDPGILNAQLTDSQWKELTTDGTPLNNTWKYRMDEIAVYLDYLKKKNVEVMFRPFHEMNQGKFWWGGRPGPEGTAKLYRMTHDYMVKEKNLSNLIWVWNLQDMSKDFADYNPGDNYWDVFSFDVYDDGFDSSWYHYILPIVGDKPMAIGECAKLPNIEMLTKQPRWVFFMPWSELVKSSNSEEEIIKLYNHDKVITLDEMSGWHNGKK
jgi:mannan endo-1,4-beta-mannosidase